MTNSDNLSPKQARCVIGCSLQAVYRIIAAGRLPATRVGRTLQIHNDDLDAYLASEPAAHRKAIIGQRADKARLAAVRLRQNQRIAMADADRIQRELNELMGVASATLARFAAAVRRVHSIDSE